MGALRDLIAAILTDSGDGRISTLTIVDGMVADHVGSQAPASRPRGAGTAAAGPLPSMCAKAPAGLEFASRLKLGAAPVEIGVVAEAE